MPHLSEKTKSKSEFLARAQICFDNGDFEEAIKRWEELLAVEYDKTVILRIAAVAWHQCQDEVMALNYLERLSPVDRENRKCKWFVKNFYDELSLLVEKYGRLGMKEAAVSIYFLLKTNSFFSFCNDEILNQLYSRELSSPSIQLLRQKLRILRERVFRIAEKDSALGKMLKSARGHLDKASDDEEGEAVGKGTDMKDVDSPVSDSEEWYEYEDADEDYYEYDYDEPSDLTNLLPRMEKEVQILQWIEKTILEKELEWVASSTISTYMKFFNDRRILDSLEKLLLEVDPVLDKFADYSGKSVSEVKDFLGSFLPGAIRDKVCNDDYLDVVRLENDLERKLLLYIRHCYKK